MAARILWLVPKNGFSDKMKGLVAKYVRSVGMNTADIFYVNVHSKVEGAYVYRNKVGDVPVPAKFSEVRAEIDRNVKAFRPKVVICSDASCMSAVNGKPITLYRAAGMVYLIDSLPVVCVDGFQHLHTDKTASMRVVTYLKKAQRYANDNTFEEPKFSYTVCRTRDQVQSAREWLLKADIISCDIETSGALISCVGFCGLRDNEIRCFVIPFICFAYAGNAFWSFDEDEIFAWNAIRDIMGSEVPKCFQNGAYDCAYFIRYRIDVRNYIFDTLHLYHSIWCELEKKLNVIASLMMDAIKFWKDDKKADEQDTYKQATEWWETFWRYNAYDTYVTTMSLRQLIKIANSQAWVRHNYWGELKQQIGPALAGTIRGLKCDMVRRTAKMKFLQRKADKALARLKVMTDEPNFNPGSSDQVCQVVYNIFGAPEKTQRTRGGVISIRTADQGYLKELTTYHPIYKFLIEAIWAVKKPLNDISKYGTGKLLSWGNRFRYGLHAGGTETGRYSGSKSPYWKGTNPQNVKPGIRELFVADKGYVFFEPDFGQSDLWFVANESGEEKLLAALHSGKDTHSLHASHFFKRSYEEIVAGVAAKDPFFMDSTTGIRQVTKRVVHGSSYRMMARTLYNTMGREAVIAAAKALGAQNVYDLSNNELVEVCARLLEEYHVMYPGLRPWFQAITDECVAAGGLVTTYGGRTRLFLGNAASDQAIQREISAQYGQAGTAGNINRTLEEIYWGHPEWELSGDCFFLTQTHDSILFLIREEKLHEYAQQILDIMRRPITVKGRTFSVPVDAKVGLSWGNSDNKKDESSLIGYKPDITIDELRRRAATVQLRYEKLLEEMKSVPFTAADTDDGDIVAHYANMIMSDEEIAA